MKRFSTALLFLIVVFASFISWGEAVTNRALMVDQEGNVNIPEVLATAAQMASNKVAIVAAEAAAREAANVARAGTNLVNDTVDAIMANEFVVYRYGYTDSLGVMVALPPDTKCRIIDFNATPKAVTADKMQLSLKYATTADASQVQPALKYSDDISKDLELIDANVSMSKSSGSYTDVEGVVYPYVFDMTFWVPRSSAGFMTVYLDADAQDGDGMTFNVVGGITGGASATITNGTQVLTFKGGFLTEVKDEVK
jgi:hypothetical protein